jgi:hypothetical protein
LGCRPRVEDDGLSVGNERGGGGPDAALLFGVERGLDLEGRVGADRLGADRTAVRPEQQPPPVQLLEVFADSDFRGAQTATEVADFDLPMLLDEFENLGLSL